MPFQQPLSIHPILDHIRAAIPGELPVHLVGGAVRDSILGRPVHELDFILPKNALEIARRVADALGGAYYPLDQERNTGRVILSQPDGERTILDFAVYQGSDLESDLRKRDFTINAIAMDLNSPHALSDPLGGLMDLRYKRLQACSPEAFEIDPIRILRGIRHAAVLNFRILPDTRKRMRQATHLIPKESVERLRDELFRILDNPNPASSIRALDLLGALKHILPETLALKGIEQQPPHISDGWNHTLDVLQKLETVLNVLGPEHDPEASAGLHLGLLVLRVGRYRGHIHTHLNTSPNINRSLRSLLFLAALYHDVGKPNTKVIDTDGGIHFYDHEKDGAKLISERTKKLHLSSIEIDRLYTIVRHHMRPLWLAQTGKLPSKRAIYRFFRETGEAGVDICLLSIADTLATYGPTLPQNTWSNHLDVIRSLLEAWWEQPDERVSPPKLLSGNDLIVELDVKPGPQIGKILEAIREAQATNQIRTREDALELARGILNKSDFRNTDQ